MGIYDRDYFRSTGSSRRFGVAGGVSATTWLIVVNVAAFLFDGVLGRAAESQYVARRHLNPIGFFTHWGSFSYSDAIDRAQVWRFFTFQFAHPSLEFIAFNMIVLFIFGRVVEPLVGARRFLAIYLLCGLSSAMLYLLMFKAGLFGDDGPDTKLVGASGAIFGVLIIAALRAGDGQLILFFPPMPVRIRTLAWTGVALTAYTVLIGGPFARSQLAHLGGALAGLVFAGFPGLLSFGGRRLGPTRSFPDWRNNPDH